MDAALAVTLLASGPAGPGCKKLIARVWLTQRFNLRTLILTFKILMRATELVAIWTDTWSDRRVLPPAGVRARVLRSLPDYQLAQTGIPWELMKAHRAKITSTCLTDP